MNGYLYVLWPVTTDTLWENVSGVDMASIAMPRRPKSDGASTLSFTVGATVVTSGLYTYDSGTRDWGILKKNHLVQYDAGYRTTSPPAETDYITQFKGFIDSVNLNRGKSENTLTINCRDFTKRLVENINENYPDQLSYDTINLYDYIDKDGPEGSQRPHAYDGWLMTDAIRDICFRAGIDTQYLWAKDEDGFNLIEDTGTRLEKHVKYFLPGFDNETFNYGFDMGEYELVPGQTINIQQEITFRAESWDDKENIRIIAFAQEPADSSPAEVYQAEIMPWPFDSGCVEDVNDDGAVNIDDLFSVLGAWGVCEECPQDVNGDGKVDIDDLFQILGAWGPC